MPPNRMNVEDLGPWMSPGDCLLFLLGGYCSRGGLAVLTTIFVSWPPHLPRRVPGEGPDYHFPEEFEGFGQIPARIRGVMYL